MGAIHTAVSPKKTVSFSDVSVIHPADKDTDWWRSAAIYQVYPRSFRDLNGDGVGDLPGITSELWQLSELGVDAIWLSPFFKSPQRDGGYDVTDYCDIDPIFGTLEDFDHLIVTSKMLDLKVIIDLVPNHCSSDNALFQAALHSAPGSAAREMFIFRDGKGENGELPPNNWKSHFGGPAWNRVIDENGKEEQWYLHLFDSSQPDWNWDNPAVHAEFERILRFWLDRGVSGFRVDVAHALVKAQGLPDWGGAANGKTVEGFPGTEAPMFGQPAVHEIYRKWNSILKEYGPDRILCAEANVDPLPRMADWVRKDEMQQAFNFSYLNCPWEGKALQEVITASLSAFDSVGAPTTWVLSNHDIVRHATRFGLTQKSLRGKDGIGPDDPQPDSALGLTRARAASLMMLALPGGVYLYQGEELGLPDNTQIAPFYRQDPTFARTQGQRIGRDGCRVPLPWTNHGASCGFSATGQTWLPQTDEWADLSRESQRQNPESTLSMYKAALAKRNELGLGSGSFAWLNDYTNDNVLAFMNGSTVVMMNMGTEAVELPDLDILLASEPHAGIEGILHPNQCVWMNL